MKFRSKFSHGFTNRGCLHCAILKAYKARDMHSFFQNETFKIFKMFKQLNTTRNSPEQPVELTQK